MERINEVAQFEKSALFVAMVLIVSYMAELYNFDKVLRKRELFLKTFFIFIICFILISCVYYMVPATILGRGILVLSLLFFMVLQWMLHVGFRASMKYRGLASKVLVLGTGNLARLIGSIVDGPNHNHVLAGYVSCATEPLLVPAGTILGDENGLIATAIKERANKIVVSLSERRGAFPLKDLLTCKFRGIDVVDAPSFYEHVTGKLLIEHITPSWFIYSNGFRISPATRTLKRTADILLSTVGLLLLSPLLPIIAVLIKLTSRGPVFFRQERVGEREKLFTLYKFRTMGNDAEKGTGAVWATENDPRVTPIGGFLRKSRLDEIPQLFNVLKGEMSMIGPRPERPEFVEKLKEIIPYYSKRHFVKPGVTGWAQIRYPYGASVEDAIEKLRFDLYYMKNISLSLELMIVFETIKVILFGRGSR
jgi:sugar transferase (PEP-CTERM system associated)